MIRQNECGSTISAHLGVDDWKFLLEAEAILNIANELVTISQAETRLSAARGPILRNVAREKITNEKIMVVGISS